MFDFKTIVKALIKWKKIEQRKMKKDRLLEEEK